MTSNPAAGSLLEREVPMATPPLMPNAAFPVPVFGAGHGNPISSHASTFRAPLPPGRNLSALRSNRGTNFIRLALAALFLLGFLGLAAYLLKDTISGYVAVTSEAPEAAEMVSKTADLRSSLHATETPPGKAPSTVVDSTQPLMGAVSNVETTPIPMAGPALPHPDISVASPGGETPLADSTPSKMTEAARAPPRPRDAVTGGLDDKPSEKVPSEAEPALKTLKAFLASSTAEERSTYVLGADLMKPLLDRYYSRNNDGPITVDHISFGRYDKQPDLGTGAHCIFHIESKTWEYPVPAMLEEQADGWKVDWLTFIELKDRKLEDFFKTYQEGKAAFHVGIFRQHYFGDEVPNRDQKDAFSIGLPRPNPFRAPVFLGKDAELARQLRERLPWEVHVWAIVELEWKKLGSQQWVELVSMPQMHWYSVPAASRPIATSEKLPVEAPAGGEALPPGIKRSPAGSAPTIQKAKPVTDQAFPPSIKRSPATRGR